VQCSDAYSVNNRRNPAKAGLKKLFQNKYIVLRLGSIFCGVYDYGKLSEVRTNDSRRIPGSVPEMYLLRDGYTCPHEWRSSVPVLRGGTTSGPIPQPRTGYTAETVQRFMVQVTDGESRKELTEKLTELDHLITTLWR
jgi:hypothetical protein